MISRHPVDLMCIRQPGADSTNEQATKLSLSTGRVLTV